MKDISDYISPARTTLDEDEDFVFEIIDRHFQLISDRYEFIKHTLRNFYLTKLGGSLFLEFL
ncbi:hypothetical protein KKH23_07220 [Patescibacteria group bacterium]|uniref:Uncharacterized protein n=1 Tax=viral metagenome TaxID=1070528 RepID=A0A6M3X4W5_9ZZZZ|nr:hypothetical protein [Patescibacteria group bacterium]MBU0846967.1 hypothetical protein [Patescibacteria group bacterium]